ncbi:hypothetical protein [Neopusillimonas maritima]|mgnify:CR=1 FL=1|jgi:hypothetical protein|uniref:Uncharacterized protein n=1 Tax=Neopusillimonas maritima TaxID=2026239 RepID=A0ABX9MTE4_9BURK|nr:hypothetical protein [Neopusillimonas maritima]MBF22580.1 hypothetical protein [Pusillimonas sp.]RII82143.1 hypothetical protein CJO09_12345 [Neopusillimonas maritima]|tara:strand:+ start:312 stop:638 length:327 start_codon:yes stop_codon:yes gene_type:complete
MKAQSTILATLPQGLILQVEMGELSFKAYVAVSEPSIEKMAELVSEEEYVQANDWHVTAVETEAQAEQQVEDLAFNMNPGDAAVFLCVDESACLATLAALGQPDAAPE